MPFEFTSDAWKDFTDQILAAGGDQATLTSVLTDMGDTFTTAINTNQQTQENADRITKENERLKEANMSLFLRIGEQRKEKDGGQPHNQEPGEKGHNVDQYLETLFQEDKK